jgi:hypothetical protein
MNTLSAVSASEIAFERKLKNELAELKCACM